MVGGESSIRDFHCDSTIEPGFALRIGIGQPGGRHVHRSGLSTLLSARIASGNRRDVPLLHKNTGDRLRFRPSRKHRSVLAVEIYDWGLHDVYPLPKPGVAGVP